MKIVPKIIGAAAILAVLVSAGYLLWKAVAACFEELDLEEDYDY